MLRTSVGNLLVNEALPPQFRSADRVLDKKGLADLLQAIALKDPGAYRDTSKRLADLGRHISTVTGGHSFGLAHLGKAKAGKKHQAEIKAKLKQLLDDDRWQGDKLHDAIIHATGQHSQKQIDEILEESLNENNPLALQVLSGSRGNKMNLATLRGSDLLYEDHRGQVIPLPVLSSYSEGLKPFEYWAGTYGARKGVIATKLAVQQAGYLSKVLNQVSHRLMVVDDDDPREDKTPRGLPVDIDDMDSAGALLAHDAGPYKRNTVLSPKILQDLKHRGIDKILVRSPVVGGSPDGGVYARDVGVRESGRLPGRGEMVGLTAAQALSEPMSQGMLSTKHSGGVAGQEKAVGGFKYIEQLINVPKTAKGVAAHATVDGTVDRIEDAPAGGKYLWVDGQQHYAAHGHEPIVKPGDKVEAGDLLSEGVPDPAQITQHKHLGEGRHRFTQALVGAMRDAGLRVHRRNVELLARGLINHVRLTEPLGDNVPDDVIPYSTLEHTYEPREGHAVGDPNRALGHYLERPVLHYTIGTKVRPSVVKELKRFGIKEVTVHKDPPPFEPEMIRGLSSLRHDPDPMTRLYGSGQKDSLQDSVQRGRTSTQLGTSFVPGLAKAVDFGRVGQVRQPEPAAPLPPEGEPLEDDMTKRKKKPQTLDLSSAAPAPKHHFFGGLGSLFKHSADNIVAYREAQDLIKAAGERLGRASEWGPLGGASPAQAPQHSGTPGAGPLPVPQPARPPQPPQNPSPPPQQLHPPSMPSPSGQQPAPAGANQQPTAAPEQVAHNQVHPARLQGFGYSPAAPSSLLDHEDAMTHVVNSAGQASPRYGGAMALGSLLDQNAISTLTQGPRRAPTEQPEPPGEEQPSAPTSQPGWLQSAVDAARAHPLAVAGIAAGTGATAWAANRFARGAPAAANATNVASRAVQSGRTVADAAHAASGFGSTLWNGVKGLGRSLIDPRNPLALALDAGSVLWPAATDGGAGVRVQAEERMNDLRQSPLSLGGAWTYATAPARPFSNINAIGSGVRHVADDVSGISNQVARTSSPGTVNRELGPNATPIVDTNRSLLGGAAQTVTNLPGVLGEAGRVRGLAQAAETLSRTHDANWAEHARRTIAGLEPMHNRWVASTGSPSSWGPGLLSRDWTDPQTGAVYTSGMRQSYYAIRRRLQGLQPSQPAP